MRLALFRPPLHASWHEDRRKMFTTTYNHENKIEIVNVWSKEDLEWTFRQVRTSFRLRYALAKLRVLKKTAAPVSHTRLTNMID